MYCPRDQRNVETVQGYNIVVLILLAIFTLGIGAVIYVLWTSRDKCPLCGSRDLLGPVGMVPMMVPGGPMGGMPPMVQPMMAAAPAPTQNCPGCGRPIVWYAEHSRWWCAAENRWL
jgi:hypothetical protein